MPSEPRRLCTVENDKTQSHDIDWFVGFGLQPLQGS